MFCFLAIIFDEKEDDKESRDVFDDTIESLRIASPTGVYTAEYSSCEFYAHQVITQNIRSLHTKEMRIIKLHLNNGQLHNIYLNRKKII